jgi:hypothetical protein
MHFAQHVVPGAIPTGLCRPFRNAAANVFFGVVWFFFSFFFFGLGYQLSGWPRIHNVKGNFRNRPYTNSHATSEARALAG